MSALPHTRPATAAAVGGTLCLALLLPGATAASALPGTPVPAGAAATATAAVPPVQEELAVAGVDRPTARELGVPAEGPAAPAVLTKQLPTDDFDLVGVTWAGGPATGVQVQVRVREAGGWSGWTTLAVEDGGPTPGSAEYEASRKLAATEPLVTDGADAVQVRVDAPAGGTVEDVEVSLVDGGTGPVRAAGAAAAPSAVGAAATTSAPAVISRAAWGADESLARNSSQNSSVKAVTVHHTASSNSYSTQAQAMSQLRSIYAYHTKTLGWSDIGYHFVVDKFGNVYEGRRGSITSMPVGAHSSGFNTATMGISALGNYEEARPTSAMLTSIAEVAAWKLGSQGLDPLSSTSLTSAGGSSRYSKGRSVTLPRIFRHLDVGYTACPGQYLSSAMSTIREKAAAAVRATPAPPRPTPAATGTRVPLVGDWNGDGGVQLGWWADGEVSLRMSPTSTVHYRLGSAGDTPVVGDWNGDGRDSVGVFRDGTWSLRNSLSTGPASETFRFGSRGDTPVVGRWGGRRTGIGVVTRDMRWLLKGSVEGGGYEKEIRFGRRGDVPMVGDWTGRGKDVLGVKRGNARHLISTQDPTGPVTSLAFGRPDDAGVVADFNRDGADTPGVGRGDLFAWRDDLRGGVALASIRFSG